ncbi:MAG TPA: hypothetical protein PKA95_11960 [Thermomicrobiales bacterium]|nr:hypothetical protein [Thermomicrobiales bacterium]
MNGDTTMAVLLPRCRLSPAEYAAVSAAYARDAALYTATAVVDEYRAVIDASGPKLRLKTLLDEMVAREGQCCSQFRFDVDETADGYQIELTVPEAVGQAATVLRQAVQVFFPSAAIAGEAA